MNFLSSILKTSFGRWAVGGLVGLVGIGLPLYIYTQRLDHQRLEAVASRDECLVEKGKLEQAVSFQNQAIEKMRADSAVSGRRATEEALKKLSQERPVQQGTGPEAMNAFVDRLLKP